MRLTISAFLMVGVLSFGAVMPASGVQPEEQLKDPALESRARAISAGLRCLVCQNQSIDNSDASLAKDLRLLVRQQLQKGGSDRDVIDYVVARYGNFVLLKPPLNNQTLLLWVTPIILLTGGGLLAIRFIRHSTTEQVTPLTKDEERAVAALIDKHNQ